MAEIPSQIEWYLARDGQQHGPLNESEMRAFVDLGHLRPTDLIWRAGFADWRPAPDVFAIHAAPHVPATAAVAARPVEAETRRPEQAAAPASASTPVHTAAEPAPRREPAPQAAAEPRREFAAPVAREPAVEIPLFSPDQLMAAAPAGMKRPEAETQARAEEPSFSAATPRPTLAAEPAPGPAAAAAQRQSERTASRPGGPQARPARPQSAPAQALRTAEPRSFENDEPDDELEPKRRIGGAAVAAMLVVAVLIGGGVTAFLKRDMLTTLLPEGGVKAVVASATTAGGAAPFLAGGTAPEAIDQTFQRLPVWQHIKLEFPEWYAERVQEAAKLATEKRGDGSIAKHLAEAMVALRRKHADQALTAGPERLRFVATAFLDNLQALAKQNVETCYGFISQGETYPAVLDMLQKPDGNAMLQKQVVAVFEAIAEGRKAPKSYLPPRKSDYDALATELNSRGWTENDLRTFSDPRALGRASPQQVCRMVQDWFAAQIAIKDPDAQLRLLVESLRPVVAG